MLSKCTKGFGFVARVRRIRFGGALGRDWPKREKRVQYRLYESPVKPGGIQYYYKTRYVKGKDGIFSVVSPPCARERKNGGIRNAARLGAHRAETRRAGEGGDGGRGHGCESLVAGLPGRGQK